MTPADTDRAVDPEGAGPELEKPSHRLFFALLPDDAVRAQIAERADALRRDGVIDARWVDPARYHVTVAFLGDHRKLRPAMIDAARLAASRMRVAPFVWTLDQAASFGGRRPPCVLQSAKVSRPLQTLWLQLRSELAQVRLGGRIEREFRAHLTVAYSHRDHLPPTPITPIDWPVRSIALMHSAVGTHDYTVLESQDLPG